MTTEDYVVVMRAESVMEGEMVKGLLEGERIPVRIPGELSTDPVTTCDETLFAIEVMVPKEHASRARQKLREAVAAGRVLEKWLAEHPDGLSEADAQETEV